MLKVKRNTGFSGAGSKIKIFINDEKAATLKQNKQIELPLPTNEATISVSQLGVHSNELIVKKGQVVEVTTRSWTYISLILLIIVLSTLNVFLSPPYNIVVPIIVGMMYLSIYHFVNGFELKVIYPES